MLHRYKKGDEPKLGLVVAEVLTGGMGAVYILEAKEHPEFRLALKSISSEKIFSPEALQRFQRESLIWISLLPHPNIVKAQTFEIEGGMPFLQLEYIAGGNLRQQLAAGIPKLRNSLRIVLEFCEGMIFLSKSGDIIHRDIKPENILLSDSGVVKITDFGLASIYGEFYESMARGAPLHSADESTKVTHAGAIMGTLPYMSPEQFLDFHNIGVESDIYSFGIVFYEMLTGSLPFNKKSPQEFAQAHLYTTAPAPLEVNPKVPPQLNEIVMQCLAKKPEQRFADFKQLSERLQNYCHSSGVEASIPKSYEIVELEEQLDECDWNNRGYAFRQLGMYDRALECYDRGLRKVESASDEGNIMITPGVDRKRPSLAAITVMLYTNKGALLGRMGQIEKATASFEAALRADPNDGAAYYRLGELAIIQGDKSKGLSLLKKSTDCEPGNADLLGKYMRFSYEAGERQQFEIAFQHFLALVVERQQTELLTGTGCYYDDALGAHDVALRCFEAALEMEPENASAWYNMGVTLHRAGQETKALACYDHAIQIHDSHAFARLYRGILALKEGRVNKAIGDLNRFLELDQQSSMAALVQSAFKGMRFGIPLESCLELCLSMLGHPLAIKHVI